MAGRGKCLNLVQKCCTLAQSTSFDSSISDEEFCWWCIIKSNHILTEFSDSLRQGRSRHHVAQVCKDWTSALFEVVVAFLSCLLTLRVTQYVLPHLYIHVQVQVHSIGREDCVLCDRFQLPRHVGSRTPSSDLSPFPENEVCYVRRWPWLKPKVIPTPQDITTFYWVKRMRLTSH